MRVGYFHSSGCTEIGGLHELLRKINPHVTWERCFPTRVKPGPKLTRPILPRDEGVTGRDLRSRAIQQLRHYVGANRLDAVVLIDDADCRFHGLEQRGLDAWMADLTRGAREATDQPDLPVFALLASPEIEVWFYADWEHSLGRLPDGALANALRRPLNAELALAGGAPNPEGFGGPFDAARGTCTVKLSGRIQALLEDPKLWQEARRPAGAGRVPYSKDLDGAAFLRMIEPTAVAQTCTAYFRPAWLKLAALR